MHRYRRLMLAAILAVLTAACGGSDSDTSPPAVSASPEAGSPGSNDSSNGPGGQPGSGPSPTPPTEPVGQPAEPAPPPAAPVLPATIAKMSIDIAGGAEVTDRENYLQAVVRVESDLETDRLEEAPAEIRGRGNSTWNMPKKPYRLRLKTAAPLLGMPAERDWALLANFADKTLARNKVAMMLGEKLGMAWTPRSRFVELHLNGEYQGVYQVYEHVKVGPARVDVDPPDPDGDIDPAKISGGWLLEVDKRYDEDACWDTPLGVPVCIKEPGLDEDDLADPAHPSSIQFAYIRNHVAAAEQALVTGDAWRNYFVPRAAIDWYLVNELMRNYDAKVDVKLGSSVYLHKTQGGPLAFGPLWDFDIGAGNIDFHPIASPQGWWIREGIWHQRLFADEGFRQDLHARWCTLQRDGVFTGAPNLVDEVVAMVGNEAIARNFERWPIIGQYVWPNFFVGPTYQSEVDYLKTWLQERVAWMSAEYDREFGTCPAAN